MNRGKYIVLEGPEGVGKTTQLLELERRLRTAGLPVRTLREPDSLSDISARTIRRLTQDPRFPLNTTSEVLLYNAARAQSLQVIKNSVEHGVICLVDRNYLTTLAIQYYGRGDIKDYDAINRIIAFAVNGVEPDLCVILDAPVKTLVDRLSKRYNGERFDKLDPAFLERVRAGYLWEAKQRRFPVVYVGDKPGETADQIWKLVSATLAIREHTPTVGEPTELKAILESKHYTAIPHEPPLDFIPAAVVTTTPPVPEESAPTEPLVQTVMSAPRNHKASFLASEIIDREVREIGADLTYQELGAEAVNYPFYIPANLPESVKGDYTATIIEILSLHKRLAHKLAAHLSQDSDQIVARRKIDETLRAVLPVAVQRIVTVRATDKQADALLAHWSRSPIAEVQSLSGRTPVTMPHSPFQESASQLLPQSLAPSASGVTLTDFTPRNELDLLPLMFYSTADRSQEELRDTILGWSYDQKAKAFDDYLAEAANGEAIAVLAKARYGWDIVSSYDAYLAFNRRVSHAHRQALTPRFGYETPSLIDDAAANDEFERCFELSLGLYSKLQATGFGTEAAYATLLGHRMRWAVSIDANDIANLSVGDSQCLKELLGEIQNKLAEVHTRLAAFCASMQQTHSLAPDEAAADKPLTKITNVRISPAPRP